MVEYFLDCYDKLFISFVIVELKVTLLCLECLLENIVGQLALVFDILNNGLILVGFKKFLPKLRFLPIYVLLVE